MTRLLIIGGSDAGISAALRAHELDPRAEVSVLLADEYPNYSICGLPFYLSGETPDHRLLAHRTAFDGIDIRTKNQIYRLLRDLAEAGAAILLYTSELKEIQMACDRAIVIFGGRVVAEIAVRDADEPTLLRAAYNLRSDDQMPEEIAAEVVAAEEAEAEVVAADLDAPQTDIGATR